MLYSCLPGADLGNNFDFRACKQGFYPLADYILVVGNKEANLGFGRHVRDPDKSKGELGIVLNTKATIMRDRWG